MEKQGGGRDGDKHASGEAATVQIPVPAPNPGLFKHKATNDILRLLVDMPYEAFTIRELSRLTDHSVYSVKSAVDVLADNNIVSAEPEGNRRPVAINRTRIVKPDDPVLRIPQPEFHEPVREALKRIHEELDAVKGVLVFGSVARGQADRLSDIDLWVLVGESGGDQHRGNELAKALGQERFDGNRYEFQILVESVDDAQGYADRLADIFTDAITLHDSKSLRAVKREVLGDD